MGFVHPSGSTALNRADYSRAPVRLFMATALLGAALSLGGCYGQDGYDLPTRAMKELSPEMVTLLEHKNMPKESPILIRVFKEESELEVWKQDTGGHYALLKVYPICRWSGAIGPKVHEGDRQAPEGFYQITPGLMNPNSNYYLAINTGFPNSYDRANNRHGAFLMIHGDCSSRGCYAMTDEQIGEIYSLARESFLGGEKSFQIQAFPFRMTPANMAAHRNNPNIAFWRMIKEGSDHFEVSHLEPKVDVCARHYVFDAVPPAGSTKPVVFNPAGPCPKYQLDPAIAEAALLKEHHDELKFTQLVRQDVPVAPLNTGTDGGMNRVFVAKLENPTYTYDNDGHLHVPPLQPGRLPPAISHGPGSENETTAVVATAPSGSGSTVTGFFGNLFGSKAEAEPASVASAEPQSHSGLFGGLFSTNHKTEQPAAPVAEPPATVAAGSHRGPKPLKHAPTAVAGLRPEMHAEPHHAVSREAEAPVPGPQATALPPPQNGLISGAQPVVPAGSFNNRWGGVQ
jgi:murein L,D-transpeptidase YafK